MPGRAPSAPLLRRFSESAGAGVIVPATVSLMRQSQIAPPAGVVTRAPSPAVPGSALAAAAAGTASGAARSNAPNAPVPSPTASNAAAATSSPAIPASAFAENSVIRRFFGAQQQTPTIGSHRASAPSVGSHRSSGAPVIGSHRGVAQPTVVDADPTPEENRSISTQLTSREWAELVEIVTRRIESRVTAELSRRGRRNLPRPM